MAQQRVFEKPIEERIWVSNQQTMIESMYLPKKCYRVYVTRNTDTYFKYLSNPFKLNDEFIQNDRNLVIALFRLWFTHMLKNSSAKNPYKIAFQMLLKKLINENRDIELVCYCKPKACHADIIREFLIEEAKEQTTAHNKHMQNIDT